MVSNKIPPLFTAQQPAIASYDYFDIAEGTGVKMFYGMAVDASGSETILTANQMDGGGEYNTNLSYESFNSSDALDTEVLFAMTAFNTPKTINGTAYVNFTAYLKTTGSSNRSFIICQSMKI